MGGAKDDFTIAFVFKLVSQGYAVASVEYRLALEAAWPAQIYDAKSAIRFLKANAEQLNLNAERIAVCGNSAGGALAQLVASTGGKPIWEDLSTGNAKYSSKADVLISWYGLNDFVQELYREPMPADLFCKVNMISPESLTAVWPEENICVTDVLLRRKGAEDPAYVKAMNPGTYVDETFPYALLQHGSDDPVVPCSQSEELARHVRAVCGEDHVQLDLVPGAGHGDPAFKTNENMQHCAAFLQRYIPCCKDSRKEMEEIKLIAVES